MSKFNFNIDITDNDTLSKSNKHDITMTQLQSYKESFFIDLDLPSGTLWGQYNIGVNPLKLKKASNWVGKYYAWGEIEPKSTYSWETYRHCNGSEYQLTKLYNIEILGIQFKCR